MDDLQRMQALLEQDKVYYVNLLEILRRGSARVLGVTEGSLLLQDEGSGAYLFALREEDRALLERIPDDATLIAGYNMWAMPLLEERFGLPWKLVVRSVAWPAREPPRVPELPGVELRLLDRSWAPWAAEHYSEHFGDMNAYLEGVADRGLLGVFVEGKPAGFVGFHPEGSIGLLEVLPRYRRRGLGRLLELAAIRLALDRGQYAFGQVEVGNTASLALQKDLGLSVSGRTLFWLSA